MYEVMGILMVIFSVFIFINLPCNDFVMCDPVIDVETINGLCIWIVGHCLCPGSCSNPHF